MTERADPADAKKLQTVTLVEKVKFPQFRARYRFNFTTGVFRSDLRDVTFAKVKVTDDDPATDKVNEATYRIETVTGDKTIRPVFGLSYYIFPVDIQSRIGWREFVPAPTIGFAFQNPQDNVYIGVAIEPLRNFQVFYGKHFGTRTEMVTRNAISEEKDSTAVVTRQRRLTTGETTWGVTFNIAVIAKIFK